MLCNSYIVELEIITNSYVTVTLDVCWVISSETFHRLILTVERQYTEKNLSVIRTNARLLFGDPLRKR